MIKNSQKGLPTFNQNLLCVSGIIIIEKKCTVFSVTFTNMQLIYIYMFFQLHENILWMQFCVLKEANLLETLFGVALGAAKPTNYIMSIFAHAFQIIGKINRQLGLRKMFLLQLLMSLMKKTIINNFACLSRLFFSIFENLKKATWITNWPYLSKLCIICVCC